MNYSNKTNTPLCYRKAGCLFKMEYKKWIFKACETRETAVYLRVNEDFEGERNAENTFLGSFFTYSSWPKSP